MGSPCVLYAWREYGRRGCSGDLLEGFCRYEYPRLVGLLSLYCGDRSVAEDLAQATLARVWQHWDRVARLDAPGLWSRRVALNLANSWHRRQRLSRRRASTVVTSTLVEGAIRPQRPRRTGAASTATQSAVAKRICKTSRAAMSAARRAKSGRSQSTDRNRPVNPSASPLARNTTAAAGTSTGTSG